MSVSSPHSVPVDKCQFPPPPPRRPKQLKAPFNLHRLEQQNNLLKHHANLRKSNNTFSTWNAEHIILSRQTRNNRGVDRVKEGREAEIRRLNQMLVSKISEAARKPPTYGSRPTYEFHPEPLIQRSLNFGARQRERQKIAAQNMSMAKRIIHSKPVYSREKWKAHGMKMAGYIANISKYVDVPFNEEEFNNQYQHYAADNASTNSRPPSGGLIPPIEESAAYKNHENSSRMKQTRSAQTLKHSSSESQTQQKFRSNANNVRSKTTKGPAKRKKRLAPSTESEDWHLEANISVGADGSALLTFSLVSLPFTENVIYLQSPLGFYVAWDDMKKDKQDNSLVFLSASLGISAQDSTCEWTFEPIAGDPNALYLKNQANGWFLSGSLKGDLFLSENASGWGKFSSKWMIEQLSNSQFLLRCGVGLYLTSTYDGKLTLEKYPVTLREKDFSEWNIVGLSIG